MPAPYIRLYSVEYVHPLVRQVTVVLLGQPVEEKSKGCHTPRGSREARVHWQRQPGDPWSGSREAIDCPAVIRHLEVQSGLTANSSSLKNCQLEPSRTKKTVQKKTKQLRFEIVKESLPVAERYGISLPCFFLETRWCERNPVSSLWYLRIARPKRFKNKRGRQQGTQINQVTNKCKVGT